MNAPSFFNREIILERVDNDYELLKQLITIFLQKTPEYLGQLGQNIQTQNAEQVRFFAHTLKGSVANFGAERAQQMAFQLENMGKDSALEQAPQAFLNLQNEIRGLLQELQTFLTEL